MSVMVRCLFCTWLLWAQLVQVPPESIMMSYGGAPFRYVDAYETKDACVQAGATMVEANQHYYGADKRTIWRCLPLGIRPSEAQ